MRKTVVAALLCFGLVACHAEPPVEPAAEPSLLDAVEVREAAPKTGYTREKFGQTWSDDVTVEFGHNGCDTRNDILHRDLDGPTFKAGTRNCVVLTGTLHDPYTGTDIPFVRGPGSKDIQVDHVVALANAWVTGAQQLDDATRRNFANDPLNLLAVSAKANLEKLDSDAAAWLPDNPSSRCSYVHRQLEVKAKYHLWVTPEEKQAMEQVLATCS